MDEEEAVETEEYGDIVIRDKDALVSIACDGYVIGGRMRAKEIKVEVVDTPPGEMTLKKISITFVTGGI